MCLTSGSSSTCIQQSAPEGFFRDQDCRQLNFFVCEILAGNGFSEPPEGTHIIFLSFIFSKIDFPPLNHVPPLVQFYLQINAQPTREWKVDFI